MFNYGLYKYITSKFISLAHDPLHSKNMVALGNTSITSQSGWIALHGARIPVFQRLASRKRGVGAVYRTEKTSLSRPE